MPDVLIATDSDQIHDEIVSALAGPEMHLRRVRQGAEVLGDLEAHGTPDLVVLDLQIGNMGGMATCMALRLEEDADRIDPVGVIMLLDRHADVFLARRSRADAWLVKPINPIQLRAAAEVVLADEPDDPAGVETRAAAAAAGIADGMAATGIE